MENPIDHIVDLGLVNFTRHPENKNYVVFRFSDAERSESFEKELVLAKIWFEKGVEERKNKTFTLFGVHKNDYKSAGKINFLVEAKYKKPIIPFKGLRYAVFLLSFIALILALIGFCDAQKKIRRSNETNSLVNPAR